MKLTVDKNALLPADGDWCERCGEIHRGYCPDDDPNNADDCAHEFVCTGTAYGGDDPRWFGEGRCYCIHCGADGDA